MFKFVQNQKNMRIILKLKVNNSSLISRKVELVPSINPDFKNKHVNTQMYTSWLKENGQKYHNEYSTYNHSGIIGGTLKNDFRRIEFKSGFAEIKINSLNEEFITDLLFGISKNPKLDVGNFYFDIIDVIPVPFECSVGQMKFFTVSPIVLKGKEKLPNGHFKQYLFSDDSKITSEMMTHTLISRIQRLNQSINTENLNVQFDSLYKKAKSRFYAYEKDVDGQKVKVPIFASNCPVIISGDPRAIESAYYLGIGHSTGAGFGCIEIWSQNKK